MEIDPKPFFERSKMSSSEISTNNGRVSDGCAALPLLESLMKQAFLAASVLAFSLTLAGCANTVKSITQVKFSPKPAKEEAMVKINGFLKNYLLDPYSAQVECSDVSDETWVWPGVGYETKYGYLVICQVNAKNKFGGYVGAKRFVFRFNGSEFEYEDVVPRMGLMKK